MRLSKFLAHPAPIKKPKLGQVENSSHGGDKRHEEDLTHMVAASACVWEIILQMNSGVCEDLGSIVAGRGVKDCHLPRSIPPLLYPLRTQIAMWMENLRDACGVSSEAGDTSTDGEAQQVVHSLSWLEFIITLNTCEHLSNSYPSHV